MIGRTLLRTITSPTRSRSISSNAVKNMRVLFCSEKFPSAFNYTKQELANHPSIKLIRCPEDQIFEEIANVDVALPFMHRFDRTLLDQANRLRYIIQFGAGLEGVDIPYASEKGIWVGNIPTDASPNALSCAEHAIYLTMAVLRRQKEMQRSIEDGKLGHPTGKSLSGSRVLVIGFGGIGKKLIPMLKPFDVHLNLARRSSWSNLTETESELMSLAEEVWQMKDLDEVLPTIDVVILACPVDETSRGMINNEFLAYCKTGVKIVNISRGALLDNDAVLQHLRDGKIGGLGLDVYHPEPIDPKHEILKFDNVVLTPHIAGVTESSYKEMAKIIAKEVLRIQEGDEPFRIVNKHLLSSTSRQSVL